MGLFEAKAYLWATAMITSLGLQSKTRFYADSGQVCQKRFACMAKTWQSAFFATDFATDFATEFATEFAPLLRPIFLKTS